MSYEPPNNWDALSPEDGEAVWHALAPLLAHHGFVYRLSPEYGALPPPPSFPPQNSFRPGKNEDFIHRLPVRLPRSETYFSPPRGTHMIGADQLGRDVYFKAVRSNSREIQVLRYLTSPQLASEHNHTLPVLSTIPVCDWTIIVQPFWGVRWHKPPLFSRSRRLQVARELLEGLSFMHSHRVSHGDIHGSNILCNHEDRRSSNPSFHVVDFHPAFIDFESSVLFPEDAVDHFVNATDLEITPPTQIRAPEQDNERWDAFAADVYNLGRCLQLTNMKDVAADILDAMTRQEPSERPSAKEALSLIQNLSQLQGKEEDDIQLEASAKKDSL